MTAWDGSPIRITNEWFAMCVCKPFILYMCT